jgi:DNA-directed RNA polymerase specialized sigma subunit
LPPYCPPASLPTAARSIVSSSAVCWRYERLRSDPTTGDVQFVEFAEWAEESGDARWNGRRMAQLPFAEDDSLQILVATELRHLPARQRRLVALCFNQGKTLSQAGAEMGFGRSWASKLLTGALATLKAAVDSGGERF